MVYNCDYKIYNRILYFGKEVRRVSKIEQLFSGLFRKKDGKRPATEQEVVNGVIGRYEASLQELQRTGSLNYHGLFQQLETDINEQGLSLGSVIHALSTKKLRANGSQDHLRENEVVLGYQAIKERWEDYNKSKGSAEGLKGWFGRGQEWEFKLREPARNIGLEPLVFLRSVYEVFGNPEELAKKTL